MVAFGGVGEIIGQESHKIRGRHHMKRGEFHFDFDNVDDDFLEIRSVLGIEEIKCFLFHDCIKARKHQKGKKETLS